MDARTKKITVGPIGSESGITEYLSMPNTQYEEKYEFTSWSGVVSGVYMPRSDQYNDYSAMIYVNAPSGAGWSGGITSSKTIEVRKRVIDDTNFAIDLVTMRLSRTCDKIYTATIIITIDAACYYNVDLSKRIFGLNIISISYDFSNWTCTIQAKTERAYSRSVSKDSGGFV